mmetsp:Transcript_41976/g.88145  ORF Transcript_41976/g.88145 Transcript_41976/m.88145 type:complete len:89 (-) Transcript_41976:385-651(-)
MYGYRGQSWILECNTFEPLFDSTQSKEKSFSSMMLMCDVSLILLGEPSLTMPSYSLYSSSSSSYSSSSSNIASYSVIKIATQLYLTNL